MSINKKNDLSLDNVSGNSGILIGGFKAIGKSTLAKKYSNVIDLESSNFEYIIDENIKKIPIEQRKGLKNRIKNPEYPLNYYNELISNLKRNNIVLFACKTEVVNLLNKNHINYYIVYPEEKMLEEIIERCKKRGNNEEFISRVKEIYYADFPKDLNKVIWLQKGQYLEDVLIQKEIIDINSINKY